MPVDRAALAARIGVAVTKAAKKRVAAGLDLVSDGGMSKPSHANLIGRDNVIAGRDCGFDTWVDQVPLIPMWAKPAPMAEGARLAPTIPGNKVILRRQTSWSKPRLSRRKAMRSARLRIC